MGGQQGRTACNVGSAAACNVGFAACSDVRMEGQTRVHWEPNCACVERSANNSSGAGAQARGAATSKATFLQQNGFFLSIPFKLQNVFLYQYGGSTCSSPSCILQLLFWDPITLLNKIMRTRDANVDDDEF